MITTHRRVLASLPGNEAETHAGDERVSAWRAASGEVAAALADAGQAAHMMSGMFGEQSFEALVDRLLCADTLIHTWDLARATGLDEALDAEAVERAAAFLTPLDEAIRRPGGFAAKIEPAAGADPQTRLLGFAGRRV